MFKNHLKIAFRNLLRQKAYAIINISGLAIGMACCMFILLFVYDEMSYDRHHQNANRIYRVGLDAVASGTAYHVAVTPAPLAPAFIAEYPEIEAIARLYKASRVFINHENQKFYEEGFCWADSTVFQVLSFPLLYGDETTALNGPHKILITASAAQKYFGNLEATGKVLRVDNRDDYIVTGVMRDVPANSQFRFDFLASLSSLSWVQQSQWGVNPFYTYLVLRKDARPEHLMAKFPALVRRVVAPELEKGLGFTFDDAIARGFKWGYFIEPLTEIYLHSTAQQDISPHGDIRYIYILSAIAFFILMIACINFMNLATARSVLVVAQFCISLILLVGAAVVFRQLRFMQNHKLGFAQEQVVVLLTETEAMARSFETLRSELLENQDVVSVAAGSVIPGRFLDNLYGYRPEGAAQDAMSALWTARVSHDYLRTLQVELVAGRDFSRELSTDTLQACIINEAAAKTRISAGSMKKSAGWVGLSAASHFWPSSLPALACLAWLHSWRNSAPRKLPCAKCLVRRSPALSGCSPKNSSSSSSSLCSSPRQWLITS
jgi:hypothetical protein